MQAFIEALYPHILELLGGILTLFVTSAVITARRVMNQWIGEKATKALSEMLHKAIETGVRSAMVENPNANNGVIISEAIKYAKSSIPDTIAKLMPSNDVLVSLARSKIAQVLK